MANVANRIYIYSIHLFWIKSSQAKWNETEFHSCASLLNCIDFGVHYVLIYKKKPFIMSYVYFLKRRRRHRYSLLCLFIYFILHLSLTHTFFAAQKEIHWLCLVYVRNTLKCGIIAWRQYFFVCILCFTSLSIKFNCKFESLQTKCWKHGY